MFLRVVAELNPSCRRTLLASITRPVSTASQKGKENKSSGADDPIVMTDDGAVLVCWHPEREFPYEFTKPMPDPAETRKTVLKPTEIYDVFKQKPQEMVVQELARETYTTKHRWYPRSRDKRAKNTPPDREYL